MCVCARKALEVLGWVAAIGHPGVGVLSRQLSPTQIPSSACIYCSRLSTPPPPRCPPVLPRPYTCFHLHPCPGRLRGDPHIHPLVGSCVGCTPTPLLVHAAAWALFIFAPQCVCVCVHPDGWAVRRLLFHWRAPCPYGDGACLGCCTPHSPPPPADPPFPSFLIIPSHFPLLPLSLPPPLSRVVVCA